MWWPARMIRFQIRNCRLWPDPGDLRGTRTTLLCLASWHGNIWLPSTKIINAEWCVLILLFTRNVYNVVLTKEKEKSTNFVENVQNKSSYLCEIKWQFLLFHLVVYFNNAAEWIDVRIQRWATRQIRDQCFKKCFTTDFK